MIIGLLRVRNEQLILEDTISHYLKYVERIVAYDDASTDRTPEILQSFDRVEVILGHTHQPQGESRHRQLCLDRIRQLRADWALCFDADERLEGTLPTGDADGYIFSLFDGYMTPNHQSPYVAGSLSALPRLFGPERRDIMMMFKPFRFQYLGELQRVPFGYGRVERAAVNVRHYGKCLSVEHWEQTCEYYSSWPGDYGPKWQARKGKAIHTLSDFGRELYEWDALVTKPEAQVLI